MRAHAVLERLISKVRLRCCDNLMTHENAQVRGNFVFAFKSISEFRFIVKLTARSGLGWGMGPVGMYVCVCVYVKMIENP